MAISLEDAVALGKKSVYQLDSEYVSINEVVQRVSAQDFYAPINVPDFEAMVDGFAVCRRTCWIWMKALLRLVAQVMAGTSAYSIGRGETVRVMTALAASGHCCRLQAEEVIEKDGLIYPGATKAGKQYRRAGK